MIATEILNFYVLELCKKKWEMKNKIVNIIRLAYVFVRSVFVAKNGWFRFFVYKNLLVTVFCIKYKYLFHA